METKHTPGPWKIGNDETSVSSSDDFVCDCRSNFDGNLDFANARLIAAAPDLLAVLQELEESSSYWSDYDVPVGIVDRIKAAIRKATHQD
jgi:hypothetical protein